MPEPITLLEHHRRFVRVVGALTVLAIGAIGVQEYLAAAKSARDTLRIASELTASRLDRELATTRSRLELLARDPILREMQPARCTQLLTEASRVLPEYSTLWVIHLDGRALCFNREELGPDAPTSFAERPWWGAATASPTGFGTSLPYIGGVSREWIVAHTIPLLDDVGEMVGIVGASIPHGSYQQLLYTSGLPDGHLVTVADAGRRTVLRSRDVYAFIDPTAPALPAADASERSVDSAAGFRSGPSADGARHLFAFRHLEQTGWTVYTGLPIRAIVTAAGRAALTKLGFVLLLFGAPTLIFGAHLRRLGGAIEALLEWSRSHGSESTGNLRAPSPAPDVPFPELSELSHSVEKALQDRSAAVAAAHRARDRVTSILNNAVLGIYVSDSGGVVRDANRAMARMLGYSDHEEIIGLEVEAFYVDPGERRRVLAAALADPRSSIESTWRRTDGRSFPVRLSWHRIELSDGVGFEVIAEDLSERRELEDQLRQSQKLEAVGRLAGGVAHDFNNRLTVISGQAEILLDELDEEAEERTYVESILDSARRSAELTGQLLAFSRKQVVRPRVLDLNETIGAVKGIADRLLGDDVEVVERRVREATVFADAGQMEQILMNLCTNARDALPNGGRITLSTERRSLSEAEAAMQVGAEAGDYVVLAVSDTGEGMDEETRSRIFEPFFTTKPVGKGTGLGLATVYGIVSQAGGHVRVFSWPGKGSTFEVWLPWRADDAGAHGSTDVVELVTGGSGESVLVVEDEPQVRTVVVRTLERAGYTVLAAEDGFRALELIAGVDRKIDLVVSDVLMPGMKGTELARRIAERGALTRVLFLSGYSDTDPDPGLDGLAWDFLPKPFAASRLLEKVRALLERPEFPEETSLSHTGS